MLLASKMERRWGHLQERAAGSFCGNKAGFITGENICIDGGMAKLMIYHVDCGWKLENI